GPGSVRERGPAGGSGALPAAGPEGHATAHRPARPRPGAVRAAQERIRAAVRSLDPARPEGRHGPDLAGSAGHRPSRLRPHGGGAAWADLPRGGTGHVLVAGLVDIRLHPMVPPQPRLPLRQSALTAAVAALVTYQSGTASQEAQPLVGASVQRSVASQQIGRRWINHFAPTRKGK